MAACEGPVPSFINKYQEFCQIFSLKQLISCPTRVICNTSSLIDHILTNSTEKILQSGIRGGSRAAATSKMECFVIILNGCNRLTIITKHSILDVAAALDPPLGIIDCYVGSSTNFLYKKSKTD